MLTLTLYFGGADRDARRAWPRSSGGTGAPAASRSRASRPRGPRTGRPARQACSALQSTSPRLTSISSASVSVTDWPATASSRSPSQRDDARRPSARRPGGQHADTVAGPDRPPTIVPAEPAEVEVRPVDPLHRQAERPLGARRRRSRRSRGARSASARRTTACARCGSVMLSPRSADIGMHVIVVEADLGGERAVVGLDLVEHAPAE